MLRLVLHLHLRRRARVVSLGIRAKGEVEGWSGVCGVFGGWGGFLGGCVVACGVRLGVIQGGVRGAGVEYVWSVM